MQSTLNEAATLNDTACIKWLNLHQMIQSMLNDLVYTKFKLNDVVYIKWDFKWYSLH